MGPLGWESYFFVGATFALVGLSRLGMFAVIEASVFPEERYVFPVSVVLTLMTIWWLAEGVRILGGMGWKRRRTAEATWAG